MKIKTHMFLTGKVDILTRYTVYERTAVRNHIPNLHKYTPAEKLKTDGR